MKTCPIDSKKNTQLIQGEKHDRTWKFPRRCRTAAEIKRLKSFDYAEYDEFSKFDYEMLKHTPGYLCANCKYMKEDPNSVTGYYCPEVKAPDTPHGCCSAHKLITNFATDADLILYKGVSMDDVDIILREGLKPQVQTDMHSSVFGQTVSFLTDNFDDAEGFAADRDGVVLKIKVPATMVEKHGKGGAIQHYFARAIIPPTMLSRA